MKKEPLRGRRILLPIVSYTHLSVELVSCTIYNLKLQSFDFYFSNRRISIHKTPPYCNRSNECFSFHFLPHSRTFCQLHSPSTIVKSCPVPGTKPSNCGTPWPNASTQSTMKVIPIGCRASDSHRTTAIQLSYPAAGIVPSRSGI